MLRIPKRIFYLGHFYNSNASLGNPPLCGGRICARQKQIGDKNLDKTQQQLSEDLHIILMIKDNNSHDDHNQALWDLIEHSESSKAAEIVSIISTAFVGISIVGMTVNTMPDLQYTVSSSLFIIWCLLALWYQIRNIKHSFTINYSNYFYCYFALRTLFYCQCIILNIRILYIGIHAHWYHSI